LVFPICSAVSDSSGIARISYNPHQSLFAQVRDDTLNPRVGGHSALSATITVDEAIDSIGIKPDLIKVDVEGFEPRVFRGAERLLRGNNPSAICFESNPLTLSEVTSSPPELTQWLPDYHLYYIDDFDGQRRPFGDEIPNLAEISWVCNVFAVANSEGPEHWSKARTEAIQTIASIR
jgi:hypothetical protein